jgi:ATP-binding cassette subfamily B protein
MFKFFPQYDQMDCGPACLRMVARYYGRKYSLQYLRDHCFLSKDGVSLLNISKAAKNIGLATTPIKLSLEELILQIPVPAIIHWNQNHFVVLYSIKKNIFTHRYTFRIADPGHGLIKLNAVEFNKAWLNQNDKGIALYLEPNQDFYILKESKKSGSNILTYLFRYVLPYKLELAQIFLGLFIGSLITLIFPFLTQALIDRGIQPKSIQTIFIILGAQLFLFLGASVIEILRNWIMLYIGARINVRIISDFLSKLMKLPIKYFDTKLMGDFTQRIQDHERIETFLTSQSLFTLFSIINFSVFFIVLALYNTLIVITYSILTLIAISWIVLFFAKRKTLDYVRFQRRAENQDAVYELINGIQEIKLNNFQNFKRNEWEKIQVKLFQINTRTLALDQYQIVGYNFINRFKDILVTFLAAQEVIKGNMTLGALLSLSYIIGQMNNPLGQLITFFRSLQDAGISLNRLEEINNYEEEEYLYKKANLNTSTTQFHQGNITISNIHFQYEGPHSQYVLEGINMHIPQGKITAVVGASGSGKTTLMKLLLNFYQPQTGHILIGDQDLQEISPMQWRNQCGTVMQDGYIFSDTIERNIATQDEEIDMEKLYHAANTANLIDFVASLPLGFRTKIGSSGNGISGGQKQRILIARAVYKNPQYLLFDEATSALDSENENVIMKNLNYFFSGKTVIIIAHRLSTVKNADQIIVLKNGKIVESGNHHRLVTKKGDYFNLVKNQLELGN